MGCLQLAGQGNPKVLHVAFLGLERCLNELSRANPSQIGQGFKLAEPRAGNHATLQGKCRPCLSVCAEALFRTDVSG